MMALRRRSLEARLVVALVGLFVGTAVLTGVVSFIFALEDANELLDGALRQTTSLLMSRQIALPQGASELPGTEPDNDVLIWRYPARRPASSPTLPSPLKAGYQSVEWRGEDWRILVTPFQMGQWVAVAQRMEVRDEIARHSAERALLPWLLLMPLLALLVRRVVKQALLPVRRLAAHVDEHPIERAARLPELDVPTEVEPFVTSIRRLVGQLAAALEQQRRFVGNAAHELRSPVAALQLQAANLERVLVGPVARARMLPLADGIRRIQALLEQLLSMARAQHDSRGSDQLVDLGDMVKRVLPEFLAVAADKTIDLGVDALADAALVVAAPMDIEVVLRNVVGNAVKFCPAGSVVSLSVLVEGDDAVLRVSDNGPGMDDETFQVAFEPFVRGSQVLEPGSGLGLSIVAAIARRLDARVALHPNAPGGGLVFEYRQRRSARGPGASAVDIDGDAVDGDR